MDGEIFQHLRAHGGMGLHDGELLVRQPAGLVENVFVNGDLADVVKGGGGGDDGDLRGGEAVAVRLLGEPAQQQLRQRADVEHVEAALAVAELHDVAENVDHQVALAFLLIDLVRDHAHQLLLLGVEQDGVHHAAVDDQRVKGAGDEVRDTQLIGPLDVAGAALGGDHDDGDIVDPVVLVHGVQHAEAVHLRHDDVQQYQGELRSHLLKEGDALQTVFRLYNIIFLPQHVGKDCPVQLGVVYN